MDAYLCLNLSLHSVQISFQIIISFVVYQNHNIYDQIKYYKQVLDNLLFWN